MMGNPIALGLGAIPYRAGEQMRYLLSIEKAKKMLGWEPKVGLRQGLERTMEWYYDHKSR